MFNLIISLCGFFSCYYAPALCVVISCAITLGAYVFCHTLRLEKTQGAVAYLYSGLLTGLVTQCIVFFWQKHAYILLALGSMAVFVVGVVMYEVLNMRYALVNPFDEAEQLLDENGLLIRIRKSDQCIEETFAQPWLTLGYPLDQVIEAVGYHRSGGDDGRGGYGTYVWQTPHLRTEVTTYGRVCQSITVVCLPLPNVATRYALRENPRKGESSVIESRFLRCDNGQICPQSGYWVASTDQGTEQYFKQGELLSELSSDWTDPFWQFSRNEIDDPIPKVEPIGYPS
jgi:hypothetical protein